MKAAFNIKLQGFTPANRDAVVRLVNEATGQVVERKPFLDGTLLVRDLDPGPYEVEVRHPNLVQAIEKRRVRLFPQPAPTYVPISVPEILFRDTPIRDLPDADLRPVQQIATSVHEQLQPVANKSPGEVIRAADWTTLVGAVQDLAKAVLELTQLVAPTGHNHPEIAEKIGEVQGNLRSFAEAYGRSMLELRREIEAENLRRNLESVLEAAGASEPVRTRLQDRVKELTTMVQSDTPTFTRKLANVGTVLLTEVNELATAQGAEADTFLARTEVKQLSAIAQHYFESGTQTNPESELQTYVRTTTAGGGQKIGRLFGG